MKRWGQLSLQIVLLLVIFKASVITSAWVSDCYKGTVNIKCDQEKSIIIERAWFGRLPRLSLVTNENCDIDPHGEVDCADDRTGHVAELCSGRSACSVKVFYGRGLPRTNTVNCTKDQRLPMLYVDYICAPNDLLFTTCENRRPRLQPDLVGGYLMTLGYLDHNQDFRSKLNDKSIFPCFIDFRPVPNQDWNHLETPIFFQFTLKDLNLRETKGVCTTGPPGERDSLRLSGIHGNGSSVVLASYCGSWKAGIPLVWGGEFIKVGIRINMDLVFRTEYHNKPKKGVLIEYVAIFCPPLTSPHGGTLSYHFRDTDLNDVIEVVTYARVVCHQGLFLRPSDYVSEGGSLLTKVEVECRTKTRKWDRKMFPVVFPLACYTRSQIFAMQSTSSAPSSSPSPSTIPSVADERSSSTLAYSDSTTLSIASSSTEVMKLSSASSSTSISESTTPNASLLLSISSVTEEVIPSEPTVGSKGIYMDDVPLSTVSLTVQETPMATDEVETVADLTVNVTVPSLFGIMTTSSTTGHIKAVTTSHSAGHAYIGSTSQGPLAKGGPTKKKDPTEGTSFLPILLGILCGFTICLVLVIFFVVFMYMRRRRKQKKRAAKDHHSNRIFEARPPDSHYSNGSSGGVTNSHAPFIGFQPVAMRHSHPINDTRTLPQKAPRKSRFSGFIELATLLGRKSSLSDDRNSQSVGSCTKASTKSHALGTHSPEEGVPLCVDPRAFTLSGPCCSSPSVDTYLEPSNGISASTRLSNPARPYMVYDQNCPPQVDLDLTGRDLDPSLTVIGSGRPVSMASIQNNNYYAGGQGRNAGSTESVYEAMDDSGEQPSVPLRPTLQSRQTVCDRRSLALPPRPRENSSEMEDGYQPVEPLLRPNDVKMPIPRPANPCVPVSSSSHSNT